MHQKTENRPIGGIDSDSENRLIEPTDYRYALNIRNSIGYAGQFAVLTNVKGNVLVDNYTLPSGINKCIGSYYDKGVNTTIYFVWNSNGDHTILRFYPSKTTNAYPFGTIQEVIKFNFGWSESEHITSIELVDNKLLYWTDSVKPRKINIEKANVTEKKKSWRVYLPKNYTQPFQSWGWNIFSMDGTQLFAGVFTFTSNQNREQAFETIADYINNGATSSQYLEAETCGCDLIITEKQTNTVYINFAGNTNYQVVAENWYGLNLIDRFFDLIKWIPAFEPTYEWRKDPERQSNFVKNNVWQFRLQYVYDDNEDSRLSPISNIALNNISCNDQNYDAFNFIRVNFNNSDAVDSNVWVLLKKVRVLFRIGNDGLWRDVITLEPCDFFALNNANEFVAEYDFYNDQVTAGVSDSTVSVPFDRVPRKANALTMIQGRLVTDGSLEGYNAPECVDANLSVNIENVEAQPLYKIRGQIKVYQPTLMNEQATANQSKLLYPGAQSNAPIWQIQDAVISDDNAKPASNYPMFGGVIVAGGTIFINNNPGTQTLSPTQVAILMQQYLPEGGFVAYAAGTDYFGISKQTSRADLSQLNSGVIDFSSTSGRDRYRDLVRNIQNNPADPNFNCFSEFELEVPPGRYVIRLASHWCSFGDVLGKGAIYDLRSGRSWQQTSTNVFGVLDETGTPTWRGAVNEIVVEVTNSDVYIGQFIVKDMVLWQQLPNNSGDGYFKVFTGYLFDDNGNVGVDDLKNGISVERAVVAIDSPPIIELNRGITDHNGYFFVQDYDTQLVSILANSVSSIPATPTSLRQGLDTIYRGTDSSALTQLKAGTITPYSASTGQIWNNVIFQSNDFNDLIVPVTNRSARDTCSTIIRGSVVDNDGNPVLCNIVYTNGRVGFQNTNGEYAIIAWGSRWQNGYINSNNRIYDNIILSGLDFCTIVFDSNAISIQITEYGINPTQTPPPYSPTANFDAGVSLATETGNVIFKSQKRGGKKRYGLRYSDEAGRYTTVIPVEEIYIPFITEPLDSIGLPNVYRTGVATVSWQLNSAPPSFATNYQWLRTQDRIYGKQLSWICADITYLAQTSFAEGGSSDLPEIITSFEAGGATHIKVSLSSIVDYYRLNNESLVTYEFDEGDRLRLVADKNGVRYEGLIEYEIVNYETTTQSLILKNNFSNVEITDGCMIEIYNSLLQAESEEETWYEIGEAYPIVNGQHTVTSGTFEGAESYFRYRKVPVFDVGSNSKFYVDVFECKTISDFYQSEDEDIGRTGLVTQSLNEIYRPTLLQHSNNYFPNTQINGLSSFEPANEKELSISFGAAQRLVAIRNILMCIHERKCIPVYIGEQLLVDAQQTASVIAVSEKFFGNDRALQQDWGTQHPESVSVWNGYIYGADQRMQTVWRYANDGLNAVSDYKAKSLIRNEIAGRTSIISQFDEYNQEAVFTFIGGRPPVTLAYCEAKNRWTTAYSFTLGEMFGSYSDQLVSFVSGRLWVHDKNTLYNNFYGVQFATELWYVINKDNILPKVWQAMFLEILSAANNNGWELYDITNDNGQQSRIGKSNFVKKEAYWHSSFKRDLNTAGVVNPILNGRAMRSNMLVVKMRNGNSGLETLKGIVTSYQVSERITF